MHRHFKELVNNFIANPQVVTATILRLRPHIPNPGDHLPQQSSPLIASAESFFLKIQEVPRTYL